VGSSRVLGVLVDCWSVAGTVVGVIWATLGGAARIGRAGAAGSTLGGATGLSTATLRISVTGSSTACVKMLASLLRACIW